MRRLTIAACIALLLFGLQTSGVASEGLSRFDPATGNWRWVTFDTTRQTTLPPETSLVDWSRSYIAQRAQEFGIREGELANFDNTVYESFPDHVYVTFQRRFQDIAVKSAFVQLVFSKGADGYRLREVNNNSLGPIELTLDRENLSPPLDLTEIPGSLRPHQKAMKGLRANRKPDSSINPSRIESTAGNMGDQS